METFKEAGSGVPKAGRAQQRALRRKLFAKIHCQWKEMRPDLFGSEELREALIEFSREACGLESLETLKDLTNAKLGRVLDEMKAMKAQPQLPDCDPRFLQVPAARVPRGKNSEQAEPRAPGGGIIHLATPAQIATIKKLFGFLGWSQEFREKFVSDRYRGKSPAMLRFKDATGLTAILLNIAAARELKEKWGPDKKISRGMIRGQVPELKRRLSIDVRREEDGD
jgi:hypothetical protein